jgi:hypothetical protein
VEAGAEILSEVIEVKTNMKRSTRVAVAAGALCLAAGVVAGAQLGSILKGGVIVVAVDKFGPDINKGINSLLGQHGATTKYATKVVPILSLGDSGYIGAVQVAGPEELVRKVQGVAQLEGRFKLPIVSGMRLRGLVPVSTKSTKNISRVEGVGVSAIVDFKL